MLYAFIENRDREAMDEYMNLLIRGNTYSDLPLVGDEGEAGYDASAENDGNEYLNMTGDGDEAAQSNSAEEEMPEVYIYRERERDTYYNLFLSLAEFSNILYACLYSQGFDV